MTACRLPQLRLRPHMSRAQQERAYDPAVPSDGLTLDTDRGPVDLVAVWRALTGQPTDLTAADVHHLYDLLPATHGTVVENAARAIGTSPGSVSRAVVRHHAAQRQTTSTDNGRIRT